MTEKGVRVEDAANSMKSLCFSMEYSRKKKAFNRFYTAPFRSQNRLYHLPRRHGRRAAPAWQTCRAGVANHLARSTNGNKERKNGFTPCRERPARATFLRTAKKAPLCAAAAHAQATLRSGRWAKYRWGTHDTLVTLLNFANMKSVLSRLHVWRHEITTRFTPS